MAQVIPTKQGRVTIDGRHLDIVCSQFSNRVLLIVSEHQKLGTVMEVVRDPVITAGPTHCSTYSVRTLLGKDNPEVHVFGRALASHVLPPSMPHLLLCLGLTDHTPQLLPILLTHIHNYTPTS